MRWTALATSVCALMTAGCVSILPESEPDTLYRLSGVQLAETSGERAPVTVIINRVSAPRGLAGDRIALLRQGAIAYMAGAAWITPAPQLLEGAVIDAFYDASDLAAPARVTDGVSARYELDIELRNFEAQYDQGDRAAPLVRTALRARLLDRDKRELVGATTLDRTARAAQNRQGDIVAAFSRSVEDSARDLALWTEAAICAGSQPPSACDE